MTRVQLDPDNDEVWAEIADVKDLLSGDVKAARKAVKIFIDDQAGTRTYDAGQEDEIADVMLRRCITNWTFLLPLPSEDPSSLDKVPPAAYELLKEAVAEHVALINARPSAKTSGGSSTG